MLCVAYCLLAVVERRLVFVDGICCVLIGLSWSLFAGRCLSFVGYRLSLLVARCCSLCAVGCLLCVVR